MTLIEALVVVGLVGLGVAAMGGVVGGAVRTRVRAEQDVVGGYALDGFLEEAAARPGKAPPEFAPMRLGRFRWVRRWLAAASAPGPLVERHVTHGARGAMTRVRVRFDGSAARELAGQIELPAT